MLVLLGRSQIVLFLKELLSIKNLRIMNYTFLRVSLSQVQLVQICHSHLLVMRQSPDIMRPFSGKVLSDTKRIFNYRLSRARRNVECAFGIFSNKWKIVNKPINGNLDLSILVVKTCCALHNFIRTRDGFNVEDVMTIEGLIEIERDLPTNQFK